VNICLGGKKTHAFLGVMGYMIFVVNCLSNQVYNANIYDTKYIFEVTEYYLYLIVSIIRPSSFA